MDRPSLLRLSANAQNSAASKILNESIMEVLAPSAPNGNGATPTIEVADPLAVLEHIASLIETALGAARKELEAVGSLLSESKRAETLDRVSQFAGETQVALYAQKDRRDELVNGHGETPSMCATTAKQSDC